MPIISYENFLCIESFSSAKHSLCFKKKNLTRGSGGQGDSLHLCYPVFLQFVLRPPDQHVWILRSTVYI